MPASFRSYGNLEQPSAVVLSQELADHRQTLGRMQSERGQYDPALIEVYDDLAGIYQQHGDFEKATANYQQALQLTRINFGLDSEQQLPFLGKLILCSLSLQDWQQADTQHQLQFYLKNRLYESTDIRYAEAVVELADWKIRSLRENLLGEGPRERGWKAEEISTIYRTGLARVKDNPARNVAALALLYQGKSQADLAMARTLAETPHQFFPGTVNPYVQQQVCQNNGQGGRARQCTSVRRDNPLYPESQRDTRRNLVYRSISELERSLENLGRLLAQHPVALADQRDSVLTEIHALQAEFREFKTHSFAACCAQGTPLAHR
ncbi:MAG: tetratricopeptide repeat protein [Gammaproteobacteria bacterium]